MSGGAIDRLRQLSAIGLVLAAALSAGLWWGSGAGTSETIPVLHVQGAGPQSAADGSITLHVAGAVHRPGLVAVAAGSRVADAIAAAGGAVGSADLAALNLAASVNDGDQIAVPWKSSAREGPQAQPAAVSDGRVRINTATEAELEALPGVGPVLAGRIVAYRTAYGPFEVVEDLLDVAGIGEAKLAALRDVVLVP